MGRAAPVLRYRAVMDPGPSGLTAVIPHAPDCEERIIVDRLRA
jgi:hypothetical protein